VEDKAVGGARWTLLSYAVSKGLTVATTIALARLLLPSDFGLVALALLTIGALSQFNDLGLGGVLVLRQDLDRRAQGTILTLMLGMSAGIAAALFFLSGVVADLFDQPQLAAVLTVLAVIPLFGGLNWFYEALLQRELEFSRRVAAQVTQSVSYAAVALTMALFGAGVWSLVAGQVAGALAYATVLVAVAPQRVLPRFDRREARAVLGAGRGFMAQGGLAFIQTNADYLVVGRTLGATQLGFYSMAYRMSDLPYQGIADPIAKVTFPGFARMRARGEDVRPAFLSTLRLVALVTCPLGILLSGAADPFTRALFGENWLPMIAVLNVLGLWAAIRTVQVTIAWLLNSVGEAGLMALISALVLLPLIPGLAVAGVFGGIAAVAWVVLADIVVSLLVLAYFADRRAHVSLRSQWLAIKPVVIASPFAWAAARAAAEASSSAPPLLSLVAAVAAGGVAFLALVTLVEPRALKQAAEQVDRAVRGRGMALADPG